MNPRRELLVAVVLTAVGGALLVLAAGRRWATLKVASPGLPALTVSVAGREAAPYVAAAGLLGLAAVAGILAVRGRWRQLIGVALAAASVAAIWAVVSGSSDVTRFADKSVAGSASVRVDRTAWPWVAAAGGALMLGGGALVGVRGAGWPGMGARYSRTRSEARSGRPVDPWTALDRGDDPTL
jgi:uncharacterized membrane protein (TIGR02234 family)